MKKIVLGFLVIASLGLAACGNNEAQTSETKASSTVTTDTMLTVKDSNGESVEVQQNPEKVVVSLKSSPSSIIRIS